MTETEAYALIERYLAGDMTDQEASDFEAQLLQDPILAHRSRQFEELTGTLQQFGRRQHLKQKMAAIHADMEAETAPEILPAQPVLQSDPKWKMFWKAHATTMAVAASVAILTVFSTLFSIQLWNTMGKQQTIRYTELRREVEKIKKNQRAINRAFNQNQKTPKNEINPGAFSGTGFALTENGYFVTSYHVIKDSDSVYIENKNGNRFKVIEVYKDLDHDLAILKVTDPNFTTFGSLPYTVANTDAELGEKVYTLGFPREDMVFGEGSLSSQSGFEGDTAAYQISIPLNPGNSGGPLFDDKGNLIGVISGKQLDAQGAAFATKSAYLMSIAQQLKSDSATRVSFNRQNTLSGRARKQQLKKLKDFIYMVKVYN
ncbi:trypsin-like peptidase domain-containing protein [Adhaeribacter sp. BT258]|uniref:Trypsin-like peptidase domain-containing protein n=1 Tax=Adhaeribacter terrigena TaxID=2793070 RepID=A0ABS1C6N0_9BACT|nr:serine protease [Adhaeribacter terrigena]MBK0404827.1 trypsin-like peptidase domain-containing protein [Adhaeribacter terrigena]